MLINDITNNPLLVISLILTPMAIFGFLSYLYLGWRKEKRQVKVNKSFLNYLSKHLKKKRTQTKPKHNIEKSLEIIEKIIDEEK